jgi:hypothetical protein
VRRAIVRALALAPLALACRTRHVVALDDGPVPLHETAVVDAAARAAPAAPAPAWCWRARPRVDVRAIDAHGAVWSVRDDRVTDETHALTAPLPDEIPCQMGGVWALEFARDGAAFLVADGRFYVRGGESVGFSVTPLCSDVRGAPWSRRAAGGWSFVSHRSGAVEPTLMLSRAPAGDVGWFAITGMDATTRAVVLDGSDSYLALSEGEHLVFVDRVNTVAGGVIAGQGERFDGLTRTAAGITAWRDDPDGSRVIVFTEAAMGPYTRVTGRRPPGPPASAVMRVDLARFVAVAGERVELSVDRGARFETVLALPSDESGLQLGRPSIGWLPGHRLAVAGVGGVAAESCAE